MGERIVCGVFARLFLVLDGVFLAGHGARLIAGYNTMSEEERKGYDERALCRFMGKLMLYCAACMLLMGADSLWPGKGLWLAGVIWLVIGAVGAVIYANTGGRFRKQTEESDSKHKEPCKKG